MSNYTFQSAPRPVQFQSKRPKYREPDDLQKTQAQTNIMHDKRVVRGNTYAANPQSAFNLTQTLQNVAGSSSSQSRRARSAARSSHSPAQYAEARESTMQTQTDDYLEELTDQVFEQENATQTDPISAQEADEEFAATLAPYFKPKPMGVSVSTEIQPGELFDFDSAIEPLLEVLIGKCLDQSLLEVLEEEEIAALQRKREKYLEEKAVLQAEMQRMEMAALRREEEKIRRMEQERERLQREREIGLKIAANEAARAFLVGLQGRVMRGLEEKGIFYDPVRKEVEQVFMAQLMESVEQELTKVKVAEKLSFALLNGAIDTVYRQVEEKRAYEREMERLRVEAEEKAREEERRRKEEEERLKREQEEKERLEREEEERKRKEEEEDDEERDRFEEEEEEEEDEN